MTEWLIKRFTQRRAEENGMVPRERYGRLSGAVGICGNVFLFAIKLTVGLMSASISVVADAVNNLSDALSSVVTLVGFRLAGKPADEDHPYGHARIEYIAGLIVSFLVLTVGIELAKTSAARIAAPGELQFSVITVAVLVFSLAIKTWMGLFNRILGRKIGSGVILATAQDSFNDAASTAVVLAALVLSRLTGIVLDGYVGLLISFYIIWAGIKLIKETSDPLLGAAPDRELVAAIEGKIRSYDGVLGIHDLMVHSYGPQRFFASVHVEVAARADVMASHDLIDNIERDCMAELGIQLVIHMDPIVNDDETVNRAREMVARAVSEIDPVLSIHDFRMVEGNTHSNLIFDVMVPPRFGMSDSELRAQIIAKIQENEAAYRCVITLDRSYVSTTK